MKQTRNTRDIDGIRGRKGEEEEDEFFLNRRESERKWWMAAMVYIRNAKLKSHN